MRKHLYVLGKKYMGTITENTNTKGIIREGCEDVWKTSQLMDGETCKKEVIWWHFRQTLDDQWEPPRWC